MGAPNLLAVWRFARAGRRARRGRSAALVVLAGAAGASVLATTAGAGRADTAFERLYEAAREPHIEIEFPVPAEPDVVERMAAVPGVDGAALAALVAVAPAGTGLVPFRDTIAFAVVAASGEGGFGGRIVEGRRFSGAPDEVQLNEVMAEDLGVEVGDRIPLVSLSRETGAGFFEGGPLPIDGDEVTAELVGIVEGAEDVADAPDPFLVVPATLTEGRDIFAASVLAGVRASEEDRDAVLERLSTAFPEAAVGPTERFDERIVDGIGVHVMGLRALAVAVAAAGVAAVVLAVGRLAAAAAADDAVAGTLGLTSGQRRQVAALRAVPAAAAAAALAVVAGVALAPVTMAGLARQAEPDPGWWLDLPVVLAVGGGVATVVVAAAAVTAGRRRRAPTPASASAPGLVDRAVSAGIPPVAAIGARRAVGGGAGRWQGRAGAVCLGIGVAAVAAVLTFAASVDRLLEDPEAWGAPVDVAVPLGFNGDEVEQLREEVLADERIEAAGVVTDATAAVELPSGDPRTVALMSMDPFLGALGWSVIEGGQPVRDGEAVLGPALREQLGLGIGDAFTVEVDGERHELRVVGEAVIYNTDQIDVGIAVPPQTAERMGAVGDGPVVILRYRDGVDIAGTVQGLIERYGVAEAITRPSSIDNLDELGSLPAVLATLVGGLGTIAALLTVTAGTGRRRRELATLRAIGATRRQVGATVLWHGLTLAVLSLLVGLPVGVAAGRLVYGAVAEGLGALVHPEVPVGAVALLAVGVLVAVCVLALPVAGHASRSRLSRALQLGHGSGVVISPL